MQTGSETQLHNNKNEMYIYISCQPTNRYALHVIIRPHTKTDAAIHEDRK
jgi:hypothetical protein